MFLLIDVGVKKCNDYLFFLVNMLINNYYLSTNDSLCVSNEGSSGEIEFTKGKILVICCNDK